LCYIEGKKSQRKEISDKFKQNLTAENIEEYMQQYSPCNSLSSCTFQSRTPSLSGMISDTFSGQSSPERFSTPEDVLSTFDIQTFNHHLVHFSTYGDQQLFRIFQNNSYFWNIYSMIAKKTISN
jgi:hypothetical protein